MGSNSNRMNDGTGFQPSEQGLCANGYFSFAKVDSSSSSSSSAEVAKSAVSEEVIKVKVTNKCFDCNKKVGVMGFKCRCGETFCGMHRYPEEHKCEFDFKKTGRDLIAKENPVVKADKVNRI
nr:zinc finger A20 and AN1 domain-containing stress-associated protein 1-like [Tanacetum cinerariifolium]